MTERKPRELRPIDAVTATVDQLQAEVKALDEQMNILLIACGCFAVIVAVLMWKVARA